MDRVLQFGRGMMGLASYLPSYRADSYAVVTTCMPGCMVKATVGTLTCQEKVYGVDVRKEALGQGTLPITALCKPFLHEGARTDTRNPVWPSCLPCRRSQAHILSHHPTPPPALAHKPLLPGGSWLSACQRRLELHGYSGAAGAKSLGQAGRARDGGCVCLWQHLGERAECSRQALGEVPPVVR